MAIYSMTGFGDGQSQSEQFVVKTEIKSVNHRFKDYRFKIPSLFAAQEMELRKILDENFKRGSFDIFISYKKPKTSKAVEEIDWDKVNAYLEKFRDFAKAKNLDLTVRPSDFLRTEFMVDSDENEQRELQNLVKGSFQAAVEKLVQSRRGEGQGLIKVIASSKEIFEKDFQQIKALSGEYQKNVEDKLKRRLSDLGKEVSLDQNRFLQEVVYYMEKLDVGEEISRLTLHLDKMQKILQGKGEVGRQLDFLLQELHRETNTIGSKSAHATISEAVVNMKVQLEKIREQVANIE